MLASRKSTAYKIMRVYEVYVHVYGVFAKQK